MTLQPTDIAALALSAGMGYAIGHPDKVKENLNYGTYLAKHKYHVISPMRQMGLGWGQALKHDLSKLSPAEFGPYRDWFAGPKGINGTQDPAVFSKWRKAVTHHYNSPGNLHHYRKLPSLTPIDDKYKLEAIADWYSVAKTKGTTDKPFKQWYIENRHKLPTENHIRAEMNKRLGLTKKAEIVLKKIATKHTLELLDTVKATREALQSARFNRLANKDEYVARNVIKARTKWMAAKQDVQSDLYRNARN